MGEEYYNNYSNNDIEGQPVPEGPAQKKQRRSKEKKPMTTGRKWASVIAMGLVFGLVAGGTMFGVDAAAERVTGRSRSECNAFSGNDIYHVCGGDEKLFRRHTAV